MAWSIWLKKRKYEALGKRRSWLWLRLLSLPILALTRFAVLLPGRAIAGQEALAYFYIALFTVGPLTWFGLHWIIGLMLSPGLSLAESGGVALSGLALLIVPALVISLLQGPLFMASRRWNESAFAGADQASLVHEIQPMQRFRLGEPGEIYTQTLRAPAGVRVERVDALLGDV